MRALALVALLALTADARDGRFERTNSRTPQGRSADRGFLGESGAWFEFAPASGAGLPSVGNLCDQLTDADKSPLSDGGVGWWCLNGDGTSATGGIALTADNTPTDATARQCPNGPDCASVSAMRLNGTNQKYKTAAVSVGTINAMTLCWLGKLSTDKQTYMIGRDDATAGRATSLGLLSSGANAFVFKAGGSSTSLQCPGGSPGLNSVNLTCLAYNYVTDGTSVARVTVNGTVCQSSTTAVGPILDITEEWMVGARGYSGASGTEYLGGTVTGAFYVPVYLADARIAAIARAVLADAPTGSKNEALTFTRASPQFCESSDGTGSMLPNNRPCVARGGLEVHGSFVQQLLRTEELDNAAWADVGTPTVTANSVVGAGNAMTADTVDDNDAAAFEGRSQSVTVTAAAAYTMSCYAKAGTLAKIRLSLDGTTGDTTTLSSSSWTRVSVTDASTSGVSVSAQVLAGTATTDTGTLYVWGCNVTPGSSLRPYIPATSAAVTTAATSASVAVSIPVGSGGASWAATTTSPNTNGGSVWGNGAGFAQDATNRTQMYRGNTNTMPCSYLSASGNLTAGSATTVTAFTSGQVVRHACSFSGTGASSTLSNYLNGTLVNTTAPGATSAATYTTVCLGVLGPTCAAAAADDTHVSRVCFDPNPTRCR